MSWIGDKAEAAANVLKELLMQTPAARIARGDLPNVLADLSRTAEEDRKRSLGRVRDAYVGREVNFTPEELESTSAFWNPAGMLGKIVYHGSPHKFDKFDASKIGTGEGAQAYGHGIYLTDSPQIAEHYKKALLNEKGGHFSWEDRAGKEIDVHALANSAQTLDPRALAASALRQSESVDDALDFIGKASPDQFVGGLQEKKATIDGLLSFMRQGVAKRPGGSLIKADLPDEWIPKMLDWDKPLKEQPEALKAINSYVAEVKQLGMEKEAKDILEAAQLTGMPGEWFHKVAQKAFGPDALARDLQRHGLPGIRYLDGGSRGKGQGSYNYVVFPGLEDKVKILERNGQPVNALAEILK